MSTSQPPTSGRGQRHPVRAVLLLVLLVEIILVVVVGRAIGYGLTFLLLLAVSGVGALVVRSEGARAFNALSTATEAGKVPSGQVGDRAIAVVGGLLMLVPGFLTGLLGLICVVPVTRPLVRGVFGRLLSRGTLSGMVVRYRVFGTGRDVVPGQVVPDDEVTDGSASGQSGPGEVLRGEIVSRDEPGAEPRDEPGDDEAGRTS